MPERNHCRDPFTGNYYPSPVTGENHTIAWHPERNRYGFYTSFIPLFSIPSSFVLTIGAETLIEVPHSSDPASNQYRVDYDGVDGQGGSGFVELDGSRDGETAVVSYQAVGESVNTELFSPQNVQTTPGAIVSQKFPATDVLRITRGMSRVIGSAFSKRQCPVHIEQGGSSGDAPEGHVLSDGRISFAFNIDDDGLGGKRCGWGLPVTLSIADGVNNFTGSGYGMPGAAVDYILRMYTTTYPPEINTVDKWENLQALSDGLYYLTVEINPHYANQFDLNDYDHFTVNHVVDTLKTADGDDPPASPAVGQHWFDPINYISWKWNGSVWVRTPRLQVGVLQVTGGGTSFLAYGFYLNARYHYKATSNSVVGTSVSFNLYMGTSRMHIKKAVWNDISGSATPGTLPNGSGGYAVGHGLSTSYYQSSIRLESEILRLRTGSAALYHDGTTPSLYFTSAKLEFIVERDY